MARRLKTFTDCRRFLAWIVNETLAGRMEPNMASKLTYVINNIVKVLETQELDKIKSDIENLKEDIQEELV